MVEDEAADHGVEAPALERQVLRVGPAELELRLATCRKCEHCVGNVDPDRMGTSGRRALGDVPGTGGNVERPGVVSNTRGVEQRLREAHGHPSQEVPVGPGAPVPPFRLESLEPLQVMRLAHGRDYPALA